MRSQSDSSTACCASKQRFSRNSSSCFGCFARIRLLLARFNQPFGDPRSLFSSSIQDSPLLKGWLDYHAYFILITFDIFLGYHNNIHGKSNTDKLTVNRPSCFSSMNTGWRYAKHVQVAVWPHFSTLSGPKKIIWKKPSLALMIFSIILNALLLSVKLITLLHLLQYLACLLVPQQQIEMAHGDLNCV